MKTTTEEIQIHEIAEQDQAYKVNYSVIGDETEAHVDQRIRKSALKQFIKDADLNKGIYIDFANQEYDMHFDLDTFLADNCREVITQYLTENLAE